MEKLKRIYYLFRYSRTNNIFLEWIEQVEGFVAKVLSVVMVVVIFVAVGNLIILLTQELFKQPVNFLDKTLLEFFGLFLNILIALELLENITAYLQKDNVLVELVIITSLIAVARKIILLDLGKATGVQIIGLALALLTLSLCYWIIRHSNAPKSD